MPARPGDIPPTLAGAHPVDQAQHLAKRIEALEHEPGTWAREEAARLRELVRELLASARAAEK